MKKRGFTLIELLAVIVILAIIALIATPMILGVIDSAKKGAAESTAYGIVSAAETYYAEASLKGETPMTSFDLKTDSLLPYKGSKPTSGELYIRSDGKISIAIQKDGWCVTKKFEEETVTTSKSELCTTGENLDDTFSIGQAITLGGDGYHIIEINGNKLSLLKDEAVTNMYFNSVSHPVISGGYCQSDSSDNTYTFCNAYQKSDNFVNGDLSGKVEYNSEIYDYLTDRWKSTLSYKDLIEGDILLLKKDQYETLGGKSISWLNNGTSFWLMTPGPNWDGGISVQYSYYVATDGSLESATVYSTSSGKSIFGARPVIVVLKENIPVNE